MTHPDLRLSEAAAKSPGVRIAFVVMAATIFVLVTIGSFAAGAVHATEKRFETIESAIETNRDAAKGRSDRDEWTRRDVSEQLAELKANQQAQGMLLLDLRDDVKAIRNAVAPLPRAKGGE